MEGLLQHQKNIFHVFVKKKLDQENENVLNILLHQQGLIEVL